jgi:hypothetical protein
MLSKSNKKCTIYRQQAVYLLHRISKEYNLKVATKKMKVFGFVGTDRPPKNKNHYKQWNTGTS